ncbi:unnamed protein product [Darwinula stevensoni]|nr:unnamed protein product [Darwinula stevensoni]CAG0881176.1 unnamed protein product [Darwinula stevensoni]
MDYRGVRLKLRAWQADGRESMPSRRNATRTIWTVGALAALAFVFYQLFACDNSVRSGFVSSKESVLMDPNTNQLYTYGRESPFIFIGGMPRSGTTLIRAMLDAHPEVRCGEETRVVPRILQMHNHWMKSAKEKIRLEEAGLNDEVLNAAISAFILEVMVKHGEPAQRLCNKDPFTLKSGTYLMSLFPNAKFLFMIRDGRATVHSIISRKVTITGFNLNDYRQCMEKWNAAVETMYDQCRQLGSHRCLPVYYEQLVLHPKAQMKRILEFLEIPWNDSVLHHEEHINKPGGVSLSKVERSSDQVIKPINIEALTKWVGKFPKDVVDDMPKIAPMLSRLGYDPYSNPPKYGDPDTVVALNTNEISEHAAEWQLKVEQLISSKRNGSSSRR